MIIIDLFNRLRTGLWLHNEMLKNIANQNSFFPTLIVVAVILFCIALYGGGERSKNHSITY